jgi:adenylate kinase family enzyme
MVDPLTTSVITDIMEGTDLEYLKKNSNQVERIIVEEYEILLKKWAGKIDVTLKDENEFWIKNRIFIQNDKELKYLLFKRMDLWESSIREQVQEYIKNVENDQRILDSMINIFENEKYFLYWKIN